MAQDSAKEHQCQKPQTEKSVDSFRIPGASSLNVLLPKVKTLQEVTHTAQF